MHWDSSYDLLWPLLAAVAIASLSRGLDKIADAVAKRGAP